MISFTDVSHCFGARTLFSGLSLSINPGEKIGLVGPNGAGKSTLFSIIRKNMEPSSGQVYVQKNIRLGYLAQEADFSSDQTVLETVVRGDAYVQSLLAEQWELEEKGMAASMRYAEVLDQIDHCGYYTAEHKAGKILAGLGFSQSDLDRKVDQMSGGWQMRTLLAQLLVYHYDVLLLDEPTNYLDLNAAIWLKDYLRDFKGSFVMISHDRAFLTEVTNYSLVLDCCRISKVKGNYEEYEKQKTENREYLIRQKKEQDKKRKQLQEFIYRFHGQPNFSAQVRSKKAMLERMEEIVVPQRTKESIRSFVFPKAPDCGQNIISLRSISKSYGNLEVYKDFSLDIEKGERSVLIGENGAGKSTLLKILADAVAIDSGERVLGRNVKIGYFSQTRMDVLNPEKTVLEEAVAAAAGSVPASKVRSILGMFLFTGDDADKMVKVLSGGEKSRLILAKLLIDPPNFLLLDEPTTHLDVDAVEALIKALKSYTGALIFISHDIYFTQSVANEVYDVEHGKVRKICGTLDYYLEKKKKNELPDFWEPDQISSKPCPVPEVCQEKSAEKELNKSNDEEKIKAEKAIKKLTKKKNKIQSDINVKNMAINNPRTYHDAETIDLFRADVRTWQRQIEELDLKIKAQEERILNLL